MSLSRAARALRDRARRRPGKFSQRRYLASNLAYVLHEHADSEPVQRVVRDIDAHAGRLARLAAMPPVASVQGELSGAIDIWLVASLGAVPWYREALQQVCGTNLSLCWIDAADSDTQPEALFRGPAMLALDISEQAQVGVASVVLRPGGHDLQVNVEGAFVWPTDRYHALRAMERLIQRDVDQWMPLRALWTMPADATLGDEILRARTR